MEDKYSQSLIKDEEQLKLIVIFQSIYGSFTILFSLMFIAHIYFANTFLNDPKFFSRFLKEEVIISNPSELVRLITIMSIVMIAVGCFIGIINLLSAYFIKKRKKRIFCIVVACINCIQIPIGTILGVFILNVLSRNSVEKLYKSIKLKI